jgi:hypothetical protein
MPGKPFVTNMALRDPSTLSPRSPASLYQSSTFVDYKRVEGTNALGISVLHELEPADAAFKRAPKSLLFTYKTKHFLFSPGFRSFTLGRLNAQVLFSCSRQCEAESKQTLISLFIMLQHDPQERHGLTQLDVAKAPSSELRVVGIQCTSSENAFLGNCTCTSSSEY